MKTVLLIDDDAEYLRIMGQVFESRNWRVLTADDGEQGIRLAKAHKPAVVLCDLLMPRCNGFQVSRILREDTALRHTRIIMTSGRQFESDRQAALSAGADEYLVKPFDVGQLLQRLSGMAVGETKPAGLAPRPPASARAGTQVRFWGVRGSIPTPGAGTVHYGGNTSCVEVRAEGQIVILDAGTGLRLLGRELTAEFDDHPLDLTLLLTHTHWDHIQGLPFFLPVYQQQNRLRILGYEGARHGLDNVLTSQMESPFFPIGLRQVPANVQIEELKEMNFSVGPVQVRAWFANHPGICVGYRLVTANGSIAFFPDNEPHAGHHHSAEGNGAGEEQARQFTRREEQKLVDFLRGTDVLIMDSQYDRAEYQSHIGWGHGCVDDVVALAIKAEVKHLFLFHHDPSHDDDKISAMVLWARQIVAEKGSTLVVDAAREGLTLELS